MPLDGPIAEPDGVPNCRGAYLSAGIVAHAFPAFDRRAILPPHHLSPGPPPRIATGAAGLRRVGWLLQGDQHLSAGGQMCMEPREGPFGVRWIEEQHERAGGDKQSAEPPGELQALPGLSVHCGRQAALLRLVSTGLEHLRR